MSDRVNDKEKFVDSLLVVTGFSFDDEGEEVNRKIMKNRILELSGEDGDVKYVTKTLNETETQVLANALKDDIHKFSHTPDFTDEKFSGNVSGVAMKYKLSSLEELAKVKERFFIKGMKRRLKIVGTFMYKRVMASYEIEDLQITIPRTLPANDLELAQIVNLLNNQASSETLLAQLPFIEDPVKEREKLKAERKEDEENTAQVFKELNYSGLGG